MATPQDNKAFVLTAFDTLFNQRNYAVAEAFWSPNYLQHSAHIEPGRDGLFNLIKAAPPDLRYENALAVAEYDDVLLHGRFSNHGQRRPWIVVDVVRLKNGLLCRISITHALCRARSTAAAPVGEKVATFKSGLACRSASESFAFRCADRAVQRVVGGR
jgi:predicted SnoaL-like aldol condensation-catalyzing enzyme